jgi:gliding motility-associated lipoprotein GldD
MKKPVSLFLLSLPVILSVVCSCRHTIVPKPKGYLRIDLPEKTYVHFGDTGTASYLPLRFDYPSYGTISSEDKKNGSGFFNIEFPAFKAIVYLTYKDVKGDLASLIEQTYTMNVKNHVIKADAIDEQVINNRENDVYGILYDLKGNTATAVQFYVTDSTKHYLRGSLYFEAEPDPDSLAPVIDFFREDIIHLIETLEWEEK